jgi:phosphatidylcholine synthase
VRALAFLVHVFTACGAALALLALLSAVQGDWPAMFFWLGVALLVDGIDGIFARGLKVGERVPRWSGDVLDLVVDFTTYVFVPAYAVAASGLMPAPWSVVAASVIAVAGALYFADTRMKTEGNYFLGFPAVWNLVAFYLLLLRPAPAAAFAVVIVLAVLTFLPVRFVHPLRVRRFRPITASLLAVWAILAAYALVSDLAPDLWVTVALGVIAAYFLLAGCIPARLPFRR